MARLAGLTLLAAMTLWLTACHPPAYSQAHPDARNAGPFWQRESQRD